MKNGCLRTLVIAGLIALAAGGVTAAVGMRLGWNTNRQWSDGFFWAGAILLMIGLLTVVGGYGMHTNPILRVSETAGSTSLPERTKLWVSDLARDWQVLILLALPAGALTAVSVWLGSLADGTP